MNEHLHASTPDCTLDVIFTHPSPGHLRVEYTIANHSLLPLYLCNQLYQTIHPDKNTGKAVFGVLPNLVNVEVTAAHVMVGKAIVAVPSDMEVEALYTPCLSRVSPNQKFVEILDVELPLVPYTYYTQHTPNISSIYKPLFFGVGYFLATPYTESFIKEVDTSTGKAYSIGTLPVSSQSIIAVGPSKQQVEVLTE